MILHKKIIAHHRRPLFTEIELKAYLDLHYNKITRPHGLSQDIYQDRDFLLLVDALIDRKLLPKKALRDLSQVPKGSILNFPEEKYGFRILELVHGPCIGSILNAVIDPTFTLTEEDIVCTLLTTKRLKMIQPGKYITLIISRYDNGAAMPLIQTKPSDEYPIFWGTTRPTSPVH